MTPLASISLKAASSKSLSCLRSPWYLLSRKFSSEEKSAKSRGEKESEVLRSLDRVLEPVSQRSLSETAVLQGVNVLGDGRVRLALDFIIPGYPRVEQVMKSCEDAIYQKLEWPTGVDFSVNQVHLSSGGETEMGGVAQSLSAISHIVAVSSCKGGVGKSTTAVNLACTLAKRGLRVGILDADVYGPSLPSLLLPDENPPVVRKDPSNPKHVLPLQRKVGDEKGGLLKFLSFGHVNPRAGVPGAGGHGAAVMRGPIVSRVINQLVASTSWGELDYLIVDMPPGTGDIQITINQSLSLTGSVVVTTPHPLATTDVLKGTEMMRSMNVPTLAVVENMSHFTCDLGTRYYPFGRLDKSKLQKEISNYCDTSSVPIVSFPLSAAISNYSEDNFQDPIALSTVLGKQNSEALECYEELADTVLTGVFSVQLNAQILPQLSYNKAKKEVTLRYYTATEAIEYSIPVSTLRMRNAATGLPLEANAIQPSLKASLESGEVFPISFDLKGNYGVSIIWSDGHHADIYPFTVLKDIAIKLK